MLQQNILGGELYSRIYIRINPRTVKKRLATPTTPGDLIHSGFAVLSFLKTSDYVLHECYFMSVASGFGFYQPVPVL